MFDSQRSFYSPAGDSEWVREGVLTDAGFEVLDLLEPGPLLAGFLDALDVTTTNRIESQMALQAWSRLESWMTAGRAHAMVKVAADYRANMRFGKDTPGAGQEQVAVSLKVSPRSAGRLLHFAGCLTNSHAATSEQLALGEITVRGAENLISHSDHLSDEQIRVVEEQVLEYAKRHTPAEIGRRVDRVIASQLPEQFAEDCANAVDQRYVRFTPLPNAMGLIEAYLPIEEATTLKNTLDARAHLLKKQDQTFAIAGGLDPSALPEIENYRADALAEAITKLIGALGSAVPSSCWQGHVHLDLATALGIADNPGHIDGYGPIPAQLARKLAADAEWNMWITNGTSDLGKPVELLRITSSTYRPSAKLVDLIRSRDQRCRFPGCETKAILTDLDHALAWNSGGRTSVSNLGALCRRHHRLKTHTTWDILDSNAAGFCDWKTPTGNHLEYWPEESLVPATTSRSIPEPDPLRIPYSDDPPPF